MASTTRINKNWLKKNRKKRRNKYGAKRVKIDGIWFHSAKEGNRYLVLKDMEKCGEIKDLQLQPRYNIVIDGRPVKMKNGQAARYTADFQYTKNGELFVEEVKGVVVRDYPLRRAIIEHIYNIKITEI